MYFLFLSFINERIEIEVSFIHAFMDFKSTNFPTYGTDSTIELLSFASFVFVIDLPALWWQIIIITPASNVPVLSWQLQVSSVVPTDSYNSAWNLPALWLIIITPASQYPAFCRQFIYTQLCKHLPDFCWQMVKILALERVCIMWNPSM